VSRHWPPCGRFGNGSHRGIHIKRELGVSTFLFGKPRKKGNAEAGQLFDVAAMRFPSPVQMTLKQTATAIRSIHPRMGGAVNGPGGINRPRKRTVVGHSKLRTRRHHFL
jgi:hypothetical protein